MSFNFLKPLAVISCGALFGFTAVQFLKPETKNRSIASAPLSKLGHQQHGRSLFEIKTDLEGIATAENEVSTLKVTVEALKPSSGGLYYQWNLPQGAVLVSGSANGTLPAFAAGEKHEFSLQLRGFSKQQRKFASFEISGFVNKYQVQRDVLISSRMEDSLEYLIQKNELKRENSINKMGQKSKNRFDPKNIVR